MRDHARIRLRALGQTHRPRQLQQTAILALAKPVEIDKRAELQLLGFLVNGRLEPLDRTQRARIRSKPFGGPLRLVAGGGQRLLRQYQQISSRRASLLPVDTIQRLALFFTLFHD